MGHTMFQNVEHEEYVYSTPVLSMPKERQLAWIYDTGGWELSCGKILTEKDNAFCDEGNQRVMYTLLLLLIYLAFISLGLPDSLLGSAWPVIHQELQVPLSYAGAVTMIVSFGTICSSLMSERLTKKLGVNIVTVCSVLLTAIALYGFFHGISLLDAVSVGIPYGLGAGAIDAALNNYVALHYNSRHMSWLHCFWGVGTIISPYIMSCP